MFRQKWIGVMMTVLILVLMATGCAKPPAASSKQPVASGKLQDVVVNVIDVGQGDAILIRTPGQVTLIDTGDVPAREKLISYIKGQGVTVIDHLIITHSHADHIGGALSILENFTVKQVLSNGQPSTSPLHRNFFMAMKQQNIPYSVPQAGTQIDLGGGAFLKVLSPDANPISGTESDINNNSVVVKLVYREFSMLLPGDAEQEAEARLVQKFAGELKSQVLKSGHHGSRTSSSLSFLQAVSPKDVVISLGVNNEYHHPHPSTLKKYAENGINVYRTDKDGTVTITSDGNTFNITKEKS
jgi:competence protein ComEC